MKVFNVTEHVDMLRIRKNMAEEEIRYLLTPDALGHLTRRTVGACGLPIEPIKVYIFPRTATELVGRIHDSLRMIKNLF